MDAKQFLQTVTEQLLRKEPDIDALRSAMLDYEMAEDRRQERLYHLDRLTVDNIMALEPCWPRQLVERLFDDKDTASLSDLLKHHFGPDPIEAHWLVESLLNQDKCEIAWTAESIDELYLAIDYVCDEDLEEQIEQRWYEQNREDIYQEGYDEGYESGQESTYEIMCEEKEEAYRDGFAAGRDEAYEEIEDKKEEQEEKSIKERVEDFFNQLAVKGPAETELARTAVREALDRC